MTKIGRCMIFMTVTVILMMIGTGYSMIMDELITEHEILEGTEAGDEERTEEDTEGTRGKLHPFNPGQWNPDWVAITSGGKTRYYDKQPRRDTSKTPRWYYNDAISKGGRIPTETELLASL